MSSVINNGLPSYPHSSNNYDEVEAMLCSGVLTERDDDVRMDPFKFEDFTMQDGLNGSLEELFHSTATVPFNDHRLGLSDRSASISSDTAMADVLVSMATSATPEANSHARMSDTPSPNGTEPMRDDPSPNGIAP